jgi:hypothetical protein
VISSLTQRWRERRDSYRPAGEVINTSAFDVSSISDDTTAKAFVEAHHYSGSFPAARFRFGLYRRCDLVGVAVFSVTWPHVLRPLFGDAWKDSLELGRFVLLDDVAANGETWFLARAFEQLRALGVAGVVSFSDPHPRQSSDGRQVFGGHIGNIYQAFNARYRGLSSRATEYLLPDGTVFANRSTGKVRKGERGFVYARGQLEAFGAERYSGGDRGAWLYRALEQVARRVRHPGKHRYGWGLNRRVTRRMPEGLPYPKFQLVRAA